MRILFLDNEEDLLAVFPDDLSARLEEHGLKALVDSKANIADALETLREKRYHLAIVDLRFPGTQSGNEVIAEILERHVMPVIVYSGFEEDLKPRFEEHALIYVVPDKKIEHVVEKIAEWEKRRIFDFFSEEGILASGLQKTLALTMWEHVSRYWDYLPTEDQETLTAVASRIASTILLDLLVHGGERAGETPIHHGEIYIFSTPREYLSVGDILRTGDGNHVVLTPACDLIPREDNSAKAQEVLLAECEELAKFAERHQPLRDQIEIMKTGTPARKSKATERIERMMRQAWQNDDGRLFFLPPFGDLPGYVVDFLRLRTLPYASPEQRETLVKSRVVSLNREMAGELATRFSRYMLRLGQPTFQDKPLMEAVRRIAGVE